MSKKFLRTLIAVLLICSMLGFPTAFADENATVTGSDVNLRSGPGTNFPVIDCLPKGEIVIVTDMSNPDWYAVTHDGVSGYMSSRYLKVSQSEPDPAPAPVEPDPAPADPAPVADPTPAPAPVQVDGTPGHINAMYVRFRSGPSTSSAILGEYNNGKTLTITGRSGDWVACVIDGRAGYVFGQYVTVDGSSAPVVQPTPEPTPEPTPDPDEGGEVVIVGEDPEPTPAPTPEPTPAPTPTPEPTPEVTPVEHKAGAITANYVCFRTGPGTNYGVMSTYNKGKELTITGICGDWTACTIDGKDGFVYSLYVKEKEAEPEPTATPAPTAAPTPEPTPAPTPVPETPVTGKAGYINGDYVRFRSGPGTNYGILGEYNKGKELTITGESGGWTACVIDGVSGYVFSQYVIEKKPEREPDPTPEPTPTPAPTAAPTPEPTPAPSTPTTGEPGYITGNNVRFRGAPSMSGEIYGELFYGNAVTITGEVNGWTAVIYNGKAGYVYSQYVARGTYGTTTPSEPEEPGTPSVPAPNPGSSAKGQEVANYALQFVGYPYVWGGMSPSTGFDCSGFVYYIYGQFGYSMNRVAADQARNGVHVDPNQLQPGDVLCFYSSGDYIGHVGIYIGNNQFVHAANSRTGVIVSDLSGYYNSRGFEARRIIN